MLQRLRVGDQVRVISGKDKGREGRVIKVLVEQEKVIVEGINRIKRHEKPSAKNSQGGIVEREAPMFACKVMPIEPATGKPTRVRIKIAENGKKVRVGQGGGVLMVEG